MSSSAQRDLYPLDETAAGTEAAEPFALREQVAERLAAHRARRGRPAKEQSTLATRPDTGKRSARIAAAVAERYAQSQSYRAFLAAEAERAIRQAEAAAEVAALNAQAVADAQYKLLDELDQWSLTPPELLAPPTLVPPAQAAAAEESVAAFSDPAPVPAALNTSGLTVRLYEDVPLRITEQFTTSRDLAAQSHADEDESMALDEEISFRQGPVFEAAVPPTEIPANLIEFPRQLVAARKARPRLAEGPLREDTPVSADPAQLRIFEVEATQISTAPAVESVEPEWSSILLTRQPVIRHEHSPQNETRNETQTDYNPAPRPRTAALNLRLMAAAVDLCAVATAFLGFTAAFAWAAGPSALTPVHTSAGIVTDVVAAAAVFIILMVLYLTLFFTFSESTPGMRYARIAFCTLSDDNPTRAAMRRRIFATFLAAFPLGLGFLWALLDEDSLGWHDRISRMYQRSY